MNNNSDIGEIFGHQFMASCLVSGIEIGILCLAGGAPAIPTIPLVLTVRFAIGFFAGLEKVAADNDLIGARIVTTIITSGLAIAFVVSAAALGIIGPLGIAMYSTVVGLAVVINSAVILNAIYNKVNQSQNGPYYTVA